LANEPVWLDAEHLVELNQLLVAMTGEPFAILKPHELASVPARPRHLWLYEREENLAVLAVRLLMAVARGHVFAQGNKRTGFIAALIFLEANGWALELDDREELAELIERAVADDRLDQRLIDLIESGLVEKGEPA
jgi:death on curing protein